MQEVPRSTRSPNRAPSRLDPGEHLLQGADPDAQPGLWGEAFPAATWRRVLSGRTVHVTASGRGSLLAASAGRVRRLGAIGPEGRTLTAEELSHDWLWVDGESGGTSWRLQEPVSLPPLTVVIPTYRRERDAITQVARFLPMDAVTTVLVVDQGGTLAEHPDFRRLLDSSPALRLISQPNLGGSGGYARGLMEAASDPSAAVLLSDDDAVVSAESLRRMLVFQALAPRPTIMGTPLFSATHPSRLLAHTESIRARSFQWRSADRVHSGGIDLAGTSPEEWTFHSQREKADYTGWWGTMLPPGTVADLGLPVPLFLKWDDAEYGLRAGRKGYDHAVLPGTAVHHPPWTPHRTQMSWTARVLHRNRLAIAAAYGSGRGVIASSLAHQVKHVLAGHLLTAELWESGIDAVLSGPGTWLGNDLRRARADGAAVVSRWHHEHRPTDTPAPSRDSPFSLPRGLALSLRRLLGRRGAARTVIAVPSEQLHWRTTLGGDVIVVTGTDGAVEETFEVTGPEMRSVLARTARSHLALARRWTVLHRRYADALPESMTTDSWTALFGSDQDRVQERS